MISLKKRDIKKALKAGAKAGGVSLAEISRNILEINALHQKNTFI